MDSNQALKEFEKICLSIDSLLSKTQLEGGIDDNIEYQDTPDERLLRTEIRGMLSKMLDVKETFEYLKKPVRQTGFLRKNHETGYYELISNGNVVFAYHAGYRIEALITDFDEDTWTVSRLEYNNEYHDYYIVGESMTELEGLQVRLR